MKITNLKNPRSSKAHVRVRQDKKNILLLVKQSWQAIAPFWPLKNLIAVNPLQGLEEYPFEEALKIGEGYFQQKDLPEPMEAVNRETIKWLQAFFDEGQATISMPLRKEGLFPAWSQLAHFDEQLHDHDKEKIYWLHALPKTSPEVIAECFQRLNIAKGERELFLKLMLTTLPGWASYVKYRTDWAGLDANHPHKVTQEDYLALRLVITYLLWPNARDLISWHKRSMENANNYVDTLKMIERAELHYRIPLLKKLSRQTVQESRTPEAQLVFCIDVRSEPFRWALESTGDYQTLGFAGFFGLPIKVTDETTGASHASCPVLLSPQHEVKESPCTPEQCHQDRKGYERLKGFKSLYQSVKYTFTTPFALVEGLGMLSGAWMALRSLLPGFASKLKNATTQTFRKPVDVVPSLDHFTLDEQCNYAEGILGMMGLTQNFAPLIVFCGHGSTTQNNAFASALDCGACGGRHGGSNARLLAAILNKKEVRSHLHKQGIEIPSSTLFVAAEHNTTTDEVTLFGELPKEKVNKLKLDLDKARIINSSVRMKTMELMVGDQQDTLIRSQDWAQVRPEWGLARNAAFIVAPRDITKNIDLDGRSFLHSYHYEQDPEGKALTTILTAPMVVAEWINSQYLFSTLDNVAFGGGSKVTKNITGKMGIIQGNASDLMTGLPLQSVKSSDVESYHEPQRLMTVVYAPRAMIDKIVQEQPVLQKLLGNGWVQLACLEPETGKVFFFERDFSWQDLYGNRAQPKHETVLT